MKKYFLPVIALAAVMPVFGATRLTLPDSIGYPDEFWEENLRIAELARSEMPWGKSVPQREWENFVVPVRVNNEALDTARLVFYRELAPRVKNLSMTEAALEVNHWCHEKATYRPSDSRTSTPLATMRTSWGRCGEESTFAVAALRSVGIPARQVYTPRWAHTDDNHAWVEVWTDGRWHFLGACEPEPILDLAWFNAPASRGMLMNTRVYNGAYDGPEEVLSRNDFFTEINVTDNYAAVDTAHVTVTDINGAPLKDANVLFCLYNYGELGPIAIKKTDSAGKASLTTGLGDMFIWVYDNSGRYNFAPYSGRPLSIALGTAPAAHSQFTLTPPPQSVSLPTPTPEQVAENDVRKAYEDSVRGAYMATFFNPETAREFASRKGWDADEMAVLLPAAYGNHATITAFLESVNEADLATAIAFLHALSDKDLRDIDPDVLADHFFGAIPSKTHSTLPAPEYIRYVANPRITNEPLSTWRSFFAEAIPEADRSKFRDNPAQWAQWVQDNIATSVSLNPTRLAISPENVWRHRTDIDPRSRDVFFVAGARAMEIPARIDPVTAKPQWLGKDGEWHDAMSEPGTEPTKGPSPKGTLRLTYNGQGTVEDPQYYYHFTLSKIQNGRQNLLEFDEENTSWKKTFATEGYPLDPGTYTLVSGQRLANGAVLTDMKIFDINTGAETVAELTMRTDDTGAPQVIGSFNSENRWLDPETGSERSILDYTGRGFYVLGLIRPSHEPSSHAINDLRSRAEQVAQWPVKVILLAESPEALARFSPETLKGLPANVKVGCLPAGSQVAAELEAADLPVVIIADTFNRVVFRSDGYTINLPERINEILKKL